MKRVLPPEIYCPKCGKIIKITEITDPFEKEVLSEKGYLTGGRGTCECGVVCALGVRPMPKSPTYVLMFDIYVKK